MAALKDLVRDTSQTAPSSGLAITAGLWYGRIVAPLPADLSEMMYVVIPDLSPEIKFGPARWPVDALPVLNAEVLVAFDNRQNPWVLQVW